MAENAFVIKDDKTADWAIKMIAEAEAERDRLINLANEQIDELKERIEALGKSCDSDTAFLKSALFEYFGTVPHKETKTQSSYKLLSGSLVFKKPSIKINHDDEKLIAALDGTEFVEVKKSLRWTEFKKNLTITEEGEVLDTTTGELIDACTVEEVPATFNVKY